MSAKVTFEEARKVIESNGDTSKLSDEQLSYLILVGAKSLAQGKLQRQKRSEKVKTAIAYYNAAVASGNVDAE
jgi:hypothetical protein